MNTDDVTKLLRRFQRGPFREAADRIAEALRIGARLHGPSRSIPSAELVGTYRLRSRRLKAMGTIVPGYDEVASMLERYPEARWTIVGVEGLHGWGSILVSDDLEQAGCFSYEDTSPAQPH